MCTCRSPATHLRRAPCAGVAASSSIAAAIKMILAPAIPAEDARPLAVPRPTSSLSKAGFTTWEVANSASLAAKAARPRAAAARARGTPASRRSPGRPGPERVRRPPGPRRAGSPARPPGRRGRPAPSGNDPASQLGTHNAAGGGREAAQLLGLSTRRARGQLRCEAGGQQQLYPEGERLGAGGRAGVRVEQGELVAEQVVGGPVGLGGVEQTKHGLAGRRRALERLAALAQRRVRVDGVDGSDRAQIAPAFVQNSFSARLRRARAHAPGPCARQPARSALRSTPASPSRADRLLESPAPRPMTDGVVHYTTEPAACRSEARWRARLQVNLATTPRPRRLSLHGQMTSRRSGSWRLRELLRPTATAGSTPCSPPAAPPPRPRLALRAEVGPAPGRADLADRRAAANRHGSPSREVDLEAVLEAAAAPVGVAEVVDRGASASMPVPGRAPRRRAGRASCGRFSVPTGTQRVDAGVPRAPRRRRCCPLPRSAPGRAGTPSPAPGARARARAGPQR